MIIVRLKFWARSVCAVWLFSAAALAQSQISGKVATRSGVPIPGATVSFSNERTGIFRTASTDKSGKYEISLTSGSYYVAVDAGGFELTHSELHLSEAGSIRA